MWKTVAELISATKHDYISNYPDKCKESLRLIFMNLVWRFVDPRQHWTGRRVGGDWKRRRAIPRGRARQLPRGQRLDPGQSRRPVSGLFDAMKTELKLYLHGDRDKHSSHFWVDFMSIIEGCIGWRRRLKGVGSGQDWSGLRQTWNQWRSPDWWVKSMRDWFKCEACLNSLQANVGYKLPRRAMLPPPIVGSVL